MIIEKQIVVYFLKCDKCGHILEEDGGEVYFDTIEGIYDCAECNNWDCTYGKPTLCEFCVEKLEEENDEKQKSE